MAYNITLFIILNLLFGAIYYLELPFLEQYKIVPGQWPWKDKNVEKVNKWWDLYYKTVILVAFNTTVLTLIFQLMCLWIGNWKAPYSMEVEEMPDQFTFTWQIIFCGFLGDFGFWFQHKLLHHPFLFRNIHYIHHRHKITIGLATAYSHPIEFFLTGLVAISSGPLILGKRMHFWTFLMLYTLAQLQTLHGHCGYEFPWCPFGLFPFETAADYHDYHHTHQMDGNYTGNSCLWDFMFGDNDKYYKFIEKRDQKRTQ